MLRYVYLGLAVWGTIHPMMWFFTWFKAHDYSLAKLPRMLDAWHVNPATSGLVWDLTIAAIALTVWVVVETVQRRDLRLLLAIPATFFIGVGSGLPLHLYLRSLR